MGQRYPLPLTATMLVKANAHEAKPRYSGAGVAGDWAGGATGNEANAASATVAIVNAASAVPVADYTPKTQTGKGNGMVPSLSILGDIGIDYGAYTGEAGRDGTIAPGAPYPSVKP